jgi:hypothetical protein
MCSERKDRRGDRPRVPELSRSKSTRFVLGLTVVFAIFAPGCGRPLARAECEHLLDRYTELLAEEENPEVTPARVAQEQVAARKVARDDPRFEFETCTSRVSRADFECAMNAPTVDAIERCLVF